MRTSFFFLCAATVPLTCCGQAIAKTMLRLPDTGETTGYTNTFGEDADFTINAPYFTANGDGTVTDTITSLMWQQTDGGEMTVEDATLYCDTLTLGGYSDWRLPNAHESFSILNHQQTNPALDGDVFTATDAEYWWTSTRQANDDNKVWVTNAGGGIGNHQKTETISAGGIKRFHVRAVRDQSPPSLITQHFTIHPNGTATDELTGLVWQRAVYFDTLTWEAALGYADTLTLAGFNDWRLPNVKELRSINDESMIGPSIDGGVFGNVGSRKYWSSTTLPNQSTKAWYLFTQFGITTYDVKTRRLYVLCVRGGQDFNTAVKGEASSSLETKVYPVPFLDRATIEFSTIQERNGEFAVYTPDGSKVHVEQFRGLVPGRQRISWQADGMPSGVYFYTLSLSDGVRSVSGTGRLLLVH